MHPLALFEWFGGLNIIFHEKSCNMIMYGWEVWLASLGMTLLNRIMP